MQDERLRKLRDWWGQNLFTQEELAEACSCSQSKISRILSGKTDPPTGMLQEIYETAEKLVAQEAAR